MNREEIKNFFEGQLKDWSLAADNFEALRNVNKKEISIGDLKYLVQFNPARAVSTLAKVDSKSIRERKCFLCDENRPKEQKALEILPDWKLLVNPFPILSCHFTISHRSHVPQELLPEIGFRLAELLPGMVVFYNDDGAGASAPDHAHFQAVPFEELPLISFLDRNWNDSDLSSKLPFRIIKEAEKAMASERPVNVYFWKSESKELRFFAIPRKAHRPDLYFKDVPERRAVSPGAIDMAGVLVTPFKEDFEALSLSDVKNIFSQVAFDNE